MIAGHKILEHPADIGIEAYGSNLKAAFEQSAIALMSVILDSSNINNTKSRLIEMFASDYEQLLVKWLSEVLYLYDGENFVVGGFEIETLTSNFLKAKVKGEKFNIIKHPTKLDVKAITYHQIIVQENEHGGLIRVYLDI
ncbi:MAG: archease [Bacteroidota bacterium]|nr:archease [Bacteroidota bacterium]